MTDNKPDFSPEAIAAPTTSVITPERLKADKATIKSALASKAYPSAYGLTVVLADYIDEVERLSADMRYAEAVFATIISGNFDLDRLRFALARWRDSGDQPQPTAGKEQE